MRGWLVAGLGAVALTGCSTEDLIEGALERADGVEDVDLDAEEGSFAFEGEDGELSLDIDEETGEASFGTDEGEVTTSPTDEVPDEIAEAVDLPDDFRPRARTAGEVEGIEQVSVQGEITGGAEALLDDLEAGVRAAGWTQVERGEAGPGRGGTVMAEDDDSGRALAISLMAGEDDRPGTLQVVLFAE